MAGKPKNFQAISNVLANYDFVDIASGTGYINFYAGNTVDLKPLSNFTYYSKEVYIEGQDDEVTYQPALDLDFDTTLNRPLDLKGVGIVNIPLGYAKNGGSGVTANWYAEVTLRKYSGSESDVCTNDSQVITSSSASTAFSYITLSVDLNIPIVHYKIGDILRLTVRIMVKNDSAGQLVKAQVGCDPKGRTTGFDTTGVVPSVLTFQCPVRLNL